MTNPEEINYDGVFIGAVSKRATERICIGIREYAGNRFIDIRTYFINKNGEWIPTRKGVTLPMEAYPELAESVAGIGEALGFDGE